MHRESLADRIRAELARTDNQHVIPMSTTQAEAAARILLPVLESRGEVIHTRRKRLYAV